MTSYHTGTIQVSLSNGEEQKTELWELNVVKNTLSFITTQDGTVHNFLSVWSKLGITEDDRLFAFSAEKNGFVQRIQLGFGNTGDLRRNTEPYYFDDWELLYFFRFNQESES